MKSIEVMQERNQRIGYYSEGLKNRYLLKSIINEHAEKKIAIIMINPKSIHEIKEDTILENAIAYFTEQLEGNIKEVNVVNLFPFKEDNMDFLGEYLAGRDMHKFMAIKYNLHMMKLVIKQSDEIHLAWGDMPGDFAVTHFQTAVRDVYHLIRVFNKEKNCYIFNLKNHESLLNKSGTPFHPKQGEIIGTKKIKKMWIENNELKLNIDDSLF